MKKKRYLLLLTVFALFTVTAFSGCGKKQKLTAEDLMAEVTENTKDMKSVRMNLKADISMGIKQSGISVDLDMAMDMDMETTNDPSAAHVTGSLSMSLMGISMDMESYTVRENGKIVTYNGMGGAWTRIEQPESQIDSEGLNAMIANGTSYELQDKTEKVDGKEVYVLNGKVSGRYMEDIMGGMSDGMGDVSVDWSKIVMDMVIKVDAETKLPMEASIDCGDAMAELMEGAMASAGEDAEVSIKDFVMTCTYEGFDDVDEIVVPESVKSAARGTAGDTGSLDDFLNNSQPESDLPSDSDTNTNTENSEEILKPNADGTYTLTNFWGNEGSVNIAVPSGYEFSPYSHSTYLAFYDTLDRIGDSVSINYMMDNDYTEADMEEYYMSDVEYYQGDSSYSNLEVQEKKSVQVDGRGVSYLKFSYTYDTDSHYVEYHAWTFLSDGSVVQCDVEESSYDGECDILDDSIVDTVMSVIQE